MKQKLFGLIGVCIFISVFVGCAATQKVELYGLAGKSHSAVTPVKQTIEWWIPRHEHVLDRVQRGNVDLIFVGDSITHGWENEGIAKLWDKYYAPRNAVNMGFGGDKTQNVLWRLDHGEIDGICPKLAVLMIGTNNSNLQDNTAEEIADGIKAICARIFFYKADLFYNRRQTKIIEYEKHRTTIWPHQQLRDNGPPLCGRKKNSPPPNR